MENSGSVEVISQIYIFSLNNWTGGEPIQYSFLNENWMATMPTHRARTTFLSGLQSFSCYFCFLASFPDSNFSLAMLVYRKPIASRVSVYCGHSILGEIDN